jgi:hypothetical protein
MPLDNWARRTYATQRRTDILRAIDELSFEAKTDWLSAVVRLQGRVEHLRLDDALEILVTVYATDDQFPCSNLPK